MIISLTLIGILATAAVPMLRMPITAYMESSARAKLAADLDRVNSKLTLDFALALPNSVRVKQVGANYLIEYLEVRAKGRYRSAASGNPTQTCLATPSCGGSPDALEFGAAPACTETCFVTLGPLVGSAVVPNSDMVVVNPTNTPGITGDPYANNGPGVRAIRSTLLTNAAFATANFDNGRRITMAPQDFPAGPASKRFYVISTPVTYECNPTTRRLTKYWNYGIAPVQPTAFVGIQSAPLATNVAACTIFQIYTAGQMGSGGLGLGGLVTIQMSLSETVNGDPVPVTADLLFSAAVNDG
ncbi:MAG: hypothetical protein V4532_08920 [Pseudomonadota bacterium]